MAETLPTIQTKAGKLKSYLERDKIKEQFAMAVPKWLSVDRLFRVVHGAFMKNPKIMDCSIESILQSVMQCATLGLEPILGRAYLIPYNNSKKVDGKWVKVLECQFMPGYQGFVDLGRRSGEVKDVFAEVVYEKDEFDINYGTDRFLHHKPTLKGEPGDPIGAYTVWLLQGEIKTFEFMPLHEIYKRRDKSQAYQYAIKHPDDKNAQESPWIQWPGEQMRKTVIKHHAKLQPLSIEFMQAVELDDQAEIGAPQRGLLFDIGEGFPAIGQGKEQSTEDKFDEMVPVDIDKFAFNEYLKVCAGHFEKTVSEFKSSVVEEDQFDDFMKSFHDWEKGQKKGKEKPETKETSNKETPKTETETKPPEDKDADQEIIDQFIKTKKPGLLDWEKKNRKALPLMSENVQKEFNRKFARITGWGYDRWLHDNVGHSSKEEQPPEQTSSSGEPGEPVDAEFEPEEQEEEETEEAQTPEVVGSEGQFEAELAEAQRYAEELSKHNWGLVTNLYQIRNNDFSKLDAESWPRFLTQCSRALDHQTEKEG